MPRKEDEASPPNGPGRDAPPTRSLSSALPGVGKIDGSCENHITISHINKYYCFVVYVMNWWYSDLAGEKEFFFETKLIGAFYKKIKKCRGFELFFLRVTFSLKTPHKICSWGVLRFGCRDFFRSGEDLSAVIFRTMMCTSF